jgi:hypothetical protein
MKNFSFLLLIAALLWSAHVHGEDAEEYHPPKIEELMDIRIPDGFSIEENIDPDRPMDFRIFIVKKPEKAYVGIYLGNYPQFHGRKEPSFRERKKPFKPGEREELVTHGEGGIVREEVMIRTPRKRSGPAFIHAWIMHDLSGEDRVIGKKIMKTISGKRGMEPAEDYCVDEISGEWLRCRIYLEGYDLEDLVLSGIRWKSHTWQACFKTPEGVYVTAQKKQDVGANFGRIINIVKSSVTVSEYLERQGAWSERILKMDLPKDSICDWKNAVPNYERSPLE